MANFDAQLQRMKSLMTYGAVNENKKQTCGAMEYHAIGADGKAYGIIRENQKFYIKTADKKNEMVVESYNYIGGFNNKKQYEYSGLSEAKKNFDMKMKSINEAYSVKTNADVQKFVVSEEMSVCGKNMLNEIARIRQIMANTSAIMNESSTIGMSNTGNPEAPKTTSFNAKLGKPFDEAATAELDNDFTKTANDPEKQGGPFGDSAKTEEPKDAEYVPQGSVANQKPKGGKVVKVDEATKKVWEMMAKLDSSFTLNESCEDWGSCGLPSSEGVGSPEGHLMEDEDIAGIDDASFEGDDVEMSDVEGEEMSDEEDDDFDFEMFDDEELEDDDEDFDEADFEDEEMSDEDVDDENAEVEGEEEAEADMEAGEDDVDSLRAEIEALKARIAELEGEEMSDEEVEDFDGEEEFDDVEDVEFEDDMEEEFNPETDANYDEMEDEFNPEISEARKQELEPLIENVIRMYLGEDKLNDWGKHPGYAKKPMTLPETGSDEGDWNDESVYSEESFGKEIGSSAPFDDVVAKITDSVMESFKKKI